MAGKQVVKMMTAKEVDKLSRLEGRHAVGGCTSLYIQRAKGSASWILRVLIDGKRREIGLGPYPMVSLEQARAVCSEYRKNIRDGIDPLAERQRVKMERKVNEAKAMTFAECVDAYLGAHEDSWKNPKHRQQWRNTLATYAVPTIGALSVASVDTGLVMKVLEPIWKSKTETATRLRGRIEKVLDWATVGKYRQGENPARWRGHLDQLLANPNKIAKVEHHAALPYSEVGTFMAELEKKEGFGARALEFAILCASRSGEVRGATWSEIDMIAKVWTIPATRMKTEKEHRVPLSGRAMKLLKVLPRIADTDLVFPGRNGLMSDMTLTATMKRMGRGDLTQHGFRSTFRDWAAEMTSYPREVCEMALAHTVGDKVEAAYRRGDLFEKRRRIMEDWAAFCCNQTFETDDVVVPIRKNAA